MSISSEAVRSPYVKTRQKLFAGMDVAAIAREAREFNRE
jgi:hypothetical protein